MARSAGSRAVSKGKQGEREVAALLRKYGFDARRGKQFSGEEGRDVVHDIDGFHVEVKRSKNQTQMWAALEQAQLIHCLLHFLIKKVLQSGSQHLLTQQGY